MAVIAYQQLLRLVSRLVMTFFRVIVELYAVCWKPLWWLCEQSSDVGVGQSHGVICRRVTSPAKASARITYDSQSISLIGKVIHRRNKALRLLLVFEPQCKESVIGPPN